MSALDWFLVISINGAIIAFGLWHARNTHSSVDWFLGAKQLPWWLVGMSMFATAVDSGDYVAVSGNAYKDGLIYISAWWLGLTIGWCTVANMVFLPMYRAGMYTNVEYLEYRFGPVARVLSVFIQIQTRTNVMGIVAYSLFLTFSALTGWGNNTWWLIVGIAIGAAAYTATGGLKSVALTDAMQSVVMLLAAVALWWTVYSDVGGWTGLETKLAAHVESGRLSADTSAAMTSVSGYHSEEAPPGLVVIGFIIVLTGYCVINHSQSMRLLAARSVWDMKLAAVVASAVTALVLWFNVTLGILGRAVIPDLEQSDQIFPRLIQEYLPMMQAGLLGIVVAGLLAGGLSTFDSIGAALASVFIRDFYGRFLVTNKDDRHYLGASRIVTVAVIALSFAYVPFLGGGMIANYLKLTGVAVVPLTTIYLMGVLTPVARGSATWGLVIGLASGLTRFLDPVLAASGFEPFPFWWTNVWWGYIWSTLATLLAMLVSSLFLGWATPEELSGLTLATSGQPIRRNRPQATKSASGTWLETSRSEVPTAKELPEGMQPGTLSWYQSPLLWTVVLLGVITYLNLFLFW